MDLFWTILWLVVMFAWFWLVVTVFTDVLRSDDLSGWAKASWVFFTIFLPYLGVFIYLIARGGSMKERNARDKEDWQRVTRANMQTVAGGASKADELAKLADLRDKGVLTTEEFDKQKARLLG
jgi:lysylphosphatidylglycerol synthetase-like protein (DUF2156 family)